MVFERTPGVTLEKIQSGRVPWPKPTGNAAKNIEDDVTPRKSRKRSRPKGDDEKTSSKLQRKSDEAVTHEKLALVPTDFPEGSSVLGIISRKTPDSMILDLLCGYCGFVRLNANELKFYQVGQYMAAHVPRQSIDKRKSERHLLQLSISPGEFNAPFTWAQPPWRNQFVLLRVTSVEDHGLIASFETPISTEDAVRVFVPLPSGRTTADYYEGQVIMGVVDEIKKGAKLIVCKTGEDMATRYFGLNTAATVQSLRAGQLVECKVKTILQNDVPKTPLLPTPMKKESYITRCFPAASVIGLEVSFCQTLQGMCPRDHLHHPLQLTSHPRYPFLQRKNVSAKAERSANTWPKRCIRFESDATCLARIAAIVASSKSLNIILTLLDHNVWLQLSPHTLNLFSHPTRGTLLTDMRVVETNQKVGVRLMAQIPVEKIEPSNLTVTDESLKEWKFDFDRALMAWCPKQKVSTETPEFKISQMNIGQKLNGKLMYSNLFDSRLIVYLSEEYINEPFCVPEDLKPGDKVRGEIMEQRPFGLLVKLSPFVTALAHTEMLLDTPSAKALSKFPVGSKGKFRVLQTDSISGSVLLTCKKSLVNIDEEELLIQCSPLEQLTSEHINKTFHVYVKKRLERGLIVGGYNGFFGMLEFDNIRKYMENPSLTDDDIASAQKYAQGCSLRVRLCQILDNGETRRLKFSLDLDATDPQIITCIGKAAAKESEQRWNASTVPATRRLQPHAQLPFQYSITDDPLEVAKTALTFFPVGTELVGRITHVSQASQSLSVAIYGPLRLWVHATELQDEMKGYPLREYHPGDSLSVVVKGIVPARLASLSPLILLEGSCRGSDAEPLPSTVGDLDMNKTYRGVIQRMDKSGLFINLSSTVVTRVDFRQLWKKGVDMEVARRDMATLTRLFPAGKVVRRVRIIHISLQKNQSYASLKPAEKEKALITFDNIEVGAALPAIVKRIDKYGIFVTLENSNKLDCLCPPNEIHDDDKEPPVLEPGDLVLAKVLDKDIPRRRIRVGLKASLFADETIDEGAEEALETVPDDEAVTTDEDADSDDSGVQIDEADDTTLSGKEHESDNASISTQSSVDEQMGADIHASDTEIQASGAESDALAEREIEAATPKREKEGLRFDPRLLETSSPDPEDPIKSLFTGRSHSEQVTDVEVEDVKQEEDEAEMERQLRRVERENAESKWKTDPKSIDDFERLLLVEGDSSKAWIAYMGYFAQLGDFDSARKNAQRGIDSLTFEQADERLNIWIAWINLEAHFGTSATLQQVYERALQYNEPLRIFYHMIDVYTDKRDWLSLDNVLHEMVKKCGDKLEVWARALGCLYARDTKLSLSAPRKRSQTLSTQSKIDEFIQRALTKLPPKYHIDLQVIVARLEFKYVSSEKGRTKFQQILANHPKRLDIWNMFLDAQTSLVLTLPERDEKEVIATREVFKSATSVDFNPHKMKSLFKKWLAFEGQVGTDSSFADIQERAREYVEAKKLQA